MDAGSNGPALCDGVAGLHGGRALVAGSLRFTARLGARLPACAVLLSRVAGRLRLPRSRTVSSALGRVAVQRSVVRASRPGGSRRAGDGSGWRTRCGRDALPLVARACAAGFGARVARIGEVLLARTGDTRAARSRADEHRGLSGVRAGGTADDDELDRLVRRGGTSRTESKRDVATDLVAAAHATAGAAGQRLVAGSCGCSSARRDIEWNGGCLDGLLKKSDVLVRGRLRRHRVDHRLPRSAESDRLANGRRAESVAATASTAGGSLA